MRRSSNQAPTNPPLRPGRNNSDSQWFVFANTSGPGALMGLGDRNGGAPPEIVGNFVFATLQSQHVRIQT